MRKLNKNDRTFILGAGITGLTAGSVTGAPIFEAKNIAGGICASCFAKPKSKISSGTMEIPGKKTYRFEICGGHWIFGADRKIEKFVNNFTNVAQYKRRASVYFSKNDLFIPYPVQNNLRFFGRRKAQKILNEIKSKNKIIPRTIRGWLEHNFGSTLCRSFFFPFNSSYTAGLYKKIAPQDAYKTPVNISAILKGMSGATGPAGYNVSFLYPPKGLDVFIDRLSKSCDIRFGKEVVDIDVDRKIIYFKKGKSIRYEKIVSTLPLNKMLEITGIKTNVRRDPFSSVLVLNIGAIKGARCPKEHWLYIPDSKSGFYRVGFYSNVNRSFISGPSEWCDERVSIYVEKAYNEGNKPTDKEITRYSSSVIRELQKNGFIGDVETLNINWVDVAYTWSWPDSAWKNLAITALKKHDIYQAGRYGLWKFQGIADSIRDGLSCESILKL